MEDAKTVPVPMTATQAELILEAVKTTTRNYAVDDWDKLQDILKKIKTVPRRVDIFYGE